MAADATFYMYAPLDARRSLSCLFLAKQQAIEIVGYYYYINLELSLKWQQFPQCQYTKDNAEKKG